MSTSSPELVRINPDEPADRIKREIGKILRAKHFVYNEANEQFTER
jgi:hypothetical protein